jgi:arginyl-tRNA synthetase
MLKEEDAAKRSLRLEITRQTGSVVQRGMGLLGIGMPERM